MKQIGDHKMTICYKPGPMQFRLLNYWLTRQSAGYPNLIFIMQTSPRKKSHLLPLDKKFVQVVYFCDLITFWGWNKHWKTNGIIFGNFDYGRGKYSSMVTKPYPWCLFQARQLFPAFGKIEASLICFLAPSSLPALGNEGFFLADSASFVDTGHLFVIRRNYRTSPLINTAVVNGHELSWVVLTPRPSLPLL